MELKIDGISGSPELESAMANQLISLFQRFKKKQVSYVAGNISAFGEKGVIIRMHDKLERIVKIAYRGDPNPLDDETIEDTYYDIADYAMIALLVREGLWPNA